MFREEGEYLLNQRVGIIEINSKKIDSIFLSYLLSSIQTQQHFITKANSSGGQANISPDIIHDTEFYAPDLPEQKQIASILRSIDDTIENNQQINKTLEEMAKAIFKEWFVDFNSPNATGKFQETEIGKIPVGWKVATFEDVFDADRGLSYKGAGLSESDATPMHNLNSVLEGGGYKTIGIKYYNGEYKDKHIVNAGEVIVANTEQGHKYMLIGYPAIVPQFYAEHGIFSHHIYRIRPKANCYLSPDFIFHLLLQPQVRDQVVGFANGTTVNMLKIEGLKKPKFAMPPKELAEKFGAIAKANRLQAEQNIEENQALINLRDTLLPKLMKGEIEIREKETV
jgi:type I restriction enzyme S subunit